MTKNDEIEELQSTLMARKLATFVPSSLSIDDLKMVKKKSNPVKKSHPKQKKSFIPPSPSVSSIATPNKNQEKKSESTSKFAFLLGNKERKPKKSISMSKMKYELPNVQKLGTASKNLRPILAVSISTLDLASIAKDERKRDKSKSPKYKIIPEAKEVDSEISDYYSGED